MNEEIIKQANELVEKYFDPESSNILFYALEYDQAKQCALIAVDEILKIDSLADKNLDYKKYNNENNRFQSYWQEVKQAIEQL